MIEALSKSERLVADYGKVRRKTEAICYPLETEDYVVQPVEYVSPPKWHLGHSTWFFETFILKPNVVAYADFDPDFNYVFNSYYESVGSRVIRTNRGNLSRPTVRDIMRYREYVDDAMLKLLQQDLGTELEQLIVLGLHHEQQHQELLYTDIKFILGHNPLLPAYDSQYRKIRESDEESLTEQFFASGQFEIGYEGDDFCYDNELGKHTVYLNDFKISRKLVTNREYLEFMNEGGYEDFRFWHSEGWEWVKQRQTHAPLYWHYIDDQWQYYTFRGLERISEQEPVCHVNFYEAAAFAAWKGARLPTEAEWEIASSSFKWGERWEWTESAYLPYPGFSKSPGAIGEYNGKFMVNQMVLRGASEVTATGHSRPSYRNFFHASSQWQYSGIRLAW